MTIQRLFASALPLALFTLAACDSPPPEPAPDTPRPARPVGSAATGKNATSPGGESKTQAQIQQQRQRTEPPPAAAGKRKVSAKPPAEVKPSEDDPVKGNWTLADATKGLPPGDTLVAKIETDLGALECTLFDDKAPITVANFVGLARGIRPWKTPEGKWEKKPAYDGTIFHRVIKGFMIQGGDAKKNGTGEAGYVIPDEVWEDAHHDRPGLLCMANRGPNTNSAQFFITDAAAAHLDYNAADPRSSGYTIFGECGPIDLVHKLASVEMDRGDRPKTPPVIKKVSITRKKGEKKPAATDEKKTAPADDKAAAEKEKAAPAGDKKPAATGATTGSKETAPPKEGDKVWAGHPDK